MIVVAANATLRIQPSVTVRFQPGARLVIQGRLTAEQAHFDGWKDLANRKMIIYRDGSTGYLRHCILENPELNMESSDVAVTRNLIAKRYSGITVARLAAPFIARNDFRHNSHYAVYKAGRRRLNAPDNY